MHAAAGTAGSLPRVFPPGALCRHFYRAFILKIFKTHPFLIDNGLSKLYDGFIICVPKE